jgi:hypothetical protein
MLFETIAPMPSWRDWYLSHDQTSSRAALQFYTERFGVAAEG